jgi:hypothetical protein
MKQIEAGSETHSLSIVFKDENNDFVVPTTASYKIYCITTDTIVVDTTSLIPSSKITVNLTGDMVVLQDSDNAKERKRICVYATDNQNRDLVKCIEYEVIATECYCG